jgi:putative copper export protein
MYGIGSPTICRYQRNQALKRRLCKTCLLLLAATCAGAMSLFGYEQAEAFHRTTWEESTKDRSFTIDLHHSFPEPTASIFFVACMAFAALAYFYYHSNDNDEHQKPILVSGAMAGLLAALSLNFGVFLGIFALEPWFLLLSLVVSDCFHFVFFRRPWHAECRKEILDDEKI